MTTNLYSNLPNNSKNSNVVDPTIQIFDAYYTQPFELDANAFAAMKGFFETRGFEKIAAESISVIIMKQAKQDGINPMQILDTARNLDGSEINALVAEIMNYNRLKTSFLGYASKFSAQQEVFRNILA